MKRSVVILLVVALALVVGGVGFFLAQPNARTAREKQLEAELAKAQADALQLKVERDKLLAAPKTALPGAEGDTATTTGVASAAAPGTAAQRNHLSDPGMRELLRKQQEAQFDLTSGKLFQKLNLNDKERESLKQYLTNKQSKESEIAMKLMDPNLTADQRRAIVAEVEASRKQSAADIHSFFNNNDDYNTFRRWEATQPERMQLQVGAAHFDAAGVPLSDEQSEQLVDVMAGVRTTSAAGPNLNDPRNISAGSLTPEGIARQLERQDADSQKVLAEAASFLSPAQLDALKKMQLQMRTLQEAGMRMTGQMFGNRK